jgi:hypothetical protein
VYIYINAQMHSIWPSIEQSFPFLNYSLSLFVYLPSLVSERFHSLQLIPGKNVFQHLWFWVYLSCFLPFQSPLPSYRPHCIISWWTICHFNYFFLATTSFPAIWLTWVHHTTLLENTSLITSFPLWKYLQGFSS